MVRTLEGIEKILVAYGNNQLIYFRCTGWNNEEGQLVNNWTSHDGVHMTYDQIQKGYEFIEEYVRSK